MSWPRQQLPVYSPLDLRALAAGIAAATSRSSAEAAVAQSLHDRHRGVDLVLTDSGTSALTLALHAAGGPAAVPAYSCFDIATACDGAGVVPILYDIDPATLGPEPQSLERALAAGARAVVIAHLFGVPVPLATIHAAAARTGAAIIEDAAQGTGASAHGRALGAGGDLGVLSFGRGKGVTGGGGGALLVVSERVRAPVAALATRLGASAKAPARVFVTTVAQYLLARPSVYGVPASLPFLGLGSTVYRRPSAPRGISAFSVGVLFRSLDVEEAEAAARRSNAERLISMIREESAGSMRPVVPTEPGLRAGYLRLPVVAEEGGALDALRSARAAELGVLPGYPASLADLEGFRERVSNPDDDFSGSRQLARTLVTFPTHSRMRERDFTAIATLVRTGR